MKGCNLNNFNLILVLIIIVIVISMIYKYEKFQSSCKANKLPNHPNNSNNRNNRNNARNGPYIYSSNNDKDKVVKLQGSSLDSNEIPIKTSEELYAAKLGMLYGTGAAHNYEIIGINEACKIKNEVDCGSDRNCLWDSVKEQCGLSEDLKIKGQCGMCKTHPECIKKGEAKNIQFNDFCEKVTGSVLDYPVEDSSYESQYSTLVKTCDNFCEDSTFN